MPFGVNDIQYHPRQILPSCWEDDAKKITHQIHTTKPENDELYSELLAKKSVRDSRHTIIFNLHTQLTSLYPWETKEMVLVPIHATDDVITIKLSTPCISYVDIYTPREWGVLSHVPLYYMEVHDEKKYIIAGESGDGFNTANEVLDTLIILNSTAKCKLCNNHRTTYAQTRRRGPPPPPHSSNPLYEKK
jgi:hypothetical protein